MAKCTFHSESIDKKKQAAAAATKKEQCTEEIFIHQTPHNCIRTRMVQMVESSSFVCAPVRFDLKRSVCVCVFAKYTDHNSACVCTSDNTDVNKHTFNCAEQQLNETKWANERKRQTYAYVCFRLDIEQYVVLTRGWKIRTHTLTHMTGTDVQWQNNQHCLMIYVLAEF